VPCWTGSTSSGSTRAEPAPVRSSSASARRRRRAAGSPRSSPGYDFAVGYLRAYSADPRAELAERGYLAETLEQVFPDDRQAQRTRLKEIVVFAYGEALNEEAAAELLSRPDALRTPMQDEAADERTAPPHTAVTISPPQVLVFLAAIVVTIAAVILVLDVVRHYRA
jgi:hypothetical protein